jgi:hypothetical protein
VLRLAAQVKRAVRDAARQQQVVAHGKAVGAAQLLQRCQVAHMQGGVASMAQEQLQDGLQVHRGLTHPSVSPQRLRCRLAPEHRLSWHACTGAQPLCIFP